jgi:hypothetical protein
MVGAAMLAAPRISQDMVTLFGVGDGRKGFLLANNQAELVLIGYMA